MPDTMLFAWMGDDVEAILLVFAVMIAFVAIVVVLDQKQRLEGNLRRSSAAVATSQGRPPARQHQGPEVVIRSVRASKNAIMTSAVETNRILGSPPS